VGRGWRREDKKARGREEGGKDQEGELTEEAEAQAMK